MPIKRRGTKRLYSGPPTLDEMNLWFWPTRETVLEHYGSIAAADERYRVYVEWCESRDREHDRGRCLAALYAPEDVQGILTALKAPMPNTPEAHQERAALQVQLLDWLDAYESAQDRTGRP
jgi:hypothetical protein